MLIDFDIFDYNDIFEFLLNDETLNERINEAITLINEN